MRINKKYKIKDIAGEKVIILQGKYGSDLTKIISFNESSEWLWNLFYEKDFSVEDVKQALLSRYDVEDAQAENDAYKWVEKLKEILLIEE